MSAIALFALLGLTVATLAGSVLGWWVRRQARHWKRERLLVIETDYHSVPDASRWRKKDDQTQP